MPQACVERCCEAGCCLLEARRYGQSQRQRSALAESKWEHLPSRRQVGDELMKARAAAALVR
eukprot:51997-Pleurochrysis_carterae.AAC.1